MHVGFFSRVLSKIRKRIIDHTSWWTCIPYTILLPAKFIVVLLLHGDSNENQTTSCEIYRYFATSRRLNGNQTILQDFVPLAYKYRSKKRQFSVFLSNLRGVQVSYHISIVPCVKLFKVLHVYNKLSHTFIISELY